MSDTNPRDRLTQQDAAGSKQRRHHHHHQYQQQQQQQHLPQSLAQSFSHFQFDRLDLDATESYTIVPSVRKKCPPSSASAAAGSCYNNKRNTTGLNTSASVCASGRVSVSKTGDNCRTDIRLQGPAQPNKATQPELKKQEESSSECVALRRSYSQLAQSRPSSSCAKLRTYSQSASSFDGSAADAATAAAALDPFAYQDRYPYSSSSATGSCAESNFKRMSAANNSRRSSRIKLPSTRAESRDEGNYFYPADSLKLYGHVNIVNNSELDDESDSGASSLPSSNGSTLNSSCASIDLVRSNRAALDPSGSPQHRRVLVSGEEQLSHQHLDGPHQLHQPPHQHPQHHQQPHLAEFSKFKNDSGTFTDSEMQPDKDATPTKQTPQQCSVDQDSADSADLLPTDDASIKSRSTLNSVVTVIERPGRSSADSQQQQQQQQLVLLPQSDSDEDVNDSEDAGRRGPRLRRRGSQQQKQQQQQQQQQPRQRQKPKQHSAEDRSSSSTLDGDEDAPPSPTSPDDSKTASGGGSANDYDDNDCDGTASEASDLTSVSAAGASSDYSLIRSQLQYDFNTWDRPAIRTFGLRVREIQCPPCETIIADWSDSELLARVRQLSRLRGAAVRLNPVSRQFTGRVRVHVNLIRPIRLGRAELPQLVPRGQSRLLQLNSGVRSQEVVQALLTALQVKEQAYKFALYEHSIDGDKSVTFRRLHPTESPLALVLSWLHGTPILEGADAANDEAGRSIFERKKIVLQENDSGLVNWSAFSLPELTNFMAILKREEAEYRESIQLKYLLLKREMRWRLKQLDKQKQALEDDWP